MKWYITLFTAMASLLLSVSGCEAPCGRQSSKDLPQPKVGWMDQPGTITCIAPGSNVLLYEGEFKRIIDWNHHTGYKTHIFLDKNGNTVIVEGFCAKKHIQKGYETPFYKEKPNEPAGSFTDW